MQTLRAHLQTMADERVITYEDVDEHFEHLGITRSSHSHKAAARSPASARGPLTPLSLDKAKSESSPATFSKSKWTADTRMVASLLEAVASANSNLGSRPEFAVQRADFECVSIPMVSITQYMKQLSHLGCDSAWFAALSTLDRVGRYTDMAITPYTAHRLILTAFVIAVRETSHCPTYQAISRLAGVQVADIKRMEETYLELLTQASPVKCSWDTLVGTEDIDIVREQLPKLQQEALKALAQHKQTMVKCPSMVTTVAVQVLGVHGINSATSSPASLTKDPSPRLSFTKRLACAQVYAAQCGTYA
eukprot:Sspe_Gene.18104::Locus_6480_Transcript_1_1_Confidence_1.000_Length_1176::g.18104::m.18104